MATISVPVSAYMLSLYPLSMSGSAAQPTAGASLRTLALGLAAPSFWSREEINSAFIEANRIWLREAEIQFSPVNIGERSEAVPADEDGMWSHLVNRLRPQGRGIGVGFVFDLPSIRGGMGWWPHCGHLGGEGPVWDIGLCWQPPGARAGPCPDR